MKPIFVTEGHVTYECLCEPPCKTGMEHIHSDKPHKSWSVLCDHQVATCQAKAVYRVQLRDYTGCIRNLCGIHAKKYKDSEKYFVEKVST